MLCPYCNNVRLFKKYDACKRCRDHLDLCFICNKIYYSKSMRVVHICDECLSNLNIECIICHQFFNKKKEIDDGYIEDKKFTCSPCFNHKLSKAYQENRDGSDNTLDDSYNRLF